MDAGMKELFDGVESAGVLRIMARRPNLDRPAVRALEALATIREGVENGTIIVLPGRLHDVPFEVYRGFTVPWTAKELGSGMRGIGDTQAEALNALADYMPARPVGVRCMTAAAEERVRAGTCPECADRGVNSVLTKLNDDGDAVTRGYQCGVCKNVFMVDAKTQEGP